MLPQSFSYKPPLRSEAIVDQFIVLAEDTTSLRPDRYGRRALTNGIQVVRATGEDLQDIQEDYTTLSPITNLAGWAQYGAALHDITWGAGSNFVQAAFRLSSPVVLHGSHGDAFGVILNDDFTSLLRHTIYIHGVVTNVHQ